MSAAAFPAMALGAMNQLSRLGEAGILVPAAVLAVARLSPLPGALHMAARWCVLALVAVAMTALTKIAFMGWGIGWSAADFTGISGHSVMAAIVLPMLALALVPARSPEQRMLAVALGTVAALLVGVTRITTGAHSASEVVVGLVLGAAACAPLRAWARRTPPAHRAPSDYAPLTASLLLGWVMLMPWMMPASPSHSIMTRVALAVSGHAQPYSRKDLQLMTRGL